MFGCLSAHPQLSIQKVDVLLGFLINYFKIFLYLCVALYYVYTCLVALVMKNGCC